MGQVCCCMWFFCDFVVLRWCCVNPPPPKKNTKKTIYFILDVYIYTYILRPILYLWLCCDVVVSGYEKFSVRPFCVLSH